MPEPLCQYLSNSFALFRLSWYNQGNQGERGESVSESIRAVERALDVLQCFSSRTPELTMTQIADQIGIHKSTVHRLLGTLERRKFVERDPGTGAYHLGIRLLQMAYLTLEHNDLRRVTTPFLRRLLDRYQESVDFSVLDQTDVVFVNHFDGPQRVKVAATTGQRLPAFATASGKAILAYLPEDTVKRLLSQGMPRYTEKTPQTPEAVLEDLRQIKEQGLAYSVQEFEDGINAVAAPILDEADRPFASVAVVGPAFRLTEQRMLEIGPEVLAIAREMAEELTIAGPVAVK
jgi:DNA-binding IclR family transcriptional regulator